MVDRALVDFSGSAQQVAGAINAVEAITVSAVSYVFRCLIGGDVPASAGLMEPIEVIAPAGSVVNAVHPACSRWRAEMSKRRSASWTSCSKRWPRRYRIGYRLPARAR